MNQPGQVPSFIVLLVFNHRVDGIMDTRGSLTLGQSLSFPASYWPLLASLDVCVVWKEIKYFH